MKKLTLHFYPLMVFVSVLGTVATPANSQPITPTNDGTNTKVTPNGNQFNIQGGIRSQDGANLFHSFDQFNVNSGQTANFISTPDTRNILGRITGGDASIINGLIQVIGGNSNLFLMNPAGIMFGPNASLNVPASFSVTTATGIGFNNNNFWFQAMGTNDYANLVGNPSGYNFNVSNPGAIVNEGNLSLNPGENLTLLGGTVINTGQLSTAGGNVTIAAVEGGSTLRISQPGHLLSLDVGSTAATGEALSGITPLSLPELLTGGEVTQATSMTVNGNGDVVLIDSNTIIADTPGTTITSGNIDVSTTPPLSKEGQGGFDTGGQVNVLGDRVALIDTNINANGINGGGQVLIGGDFQGNGIVPNSQQTFVNNNSIISADATTNGDGGQVIIWSDGITNFAGNISATGGEFSGDGGFVEVSGKQQLIFDGNINVSASFGNTGTILLDPENITVGESENSENSQTEIVEDNSEAESIENTETETTENSENVEENSEVVTTENVENSETVENTNSPTTEIAENSETAENTDTETEIIETETPIDPFAQNENADVTISAENIGELSGDVILQADNDITINEKIETTESVELKAGRSININADIDTSIGNGNIDLLGNNDEMNIANRSTGAASINQLDGTTLNAGSGNIRIELGNLGEIGDINLANLTTTGQVLVNANGGNIARVSDSSIINAGSALFQTFGSGGIGLTDAPLQLNVGNLEAVSGSGGAFFDVGNVNIGDVSEDVDGIVTAGGDIDINSDGNVTLTETISTIETVENNSEVEATENTEVTDTSGAINIEATGDIVATGSGIKGGGESVSLSATNITINDEFEETSGDADVKLEATNDITVEDIADDVLEFFPGGGEIEFRADVDGDGVGVVEMLDNEADVGSDPNTFENGADTIKTNGRNLTIAGASISLGNVDTSGLPIFSGGELLAAIDVDEGGAIPAELEDKSGLIPYEDVDFSDIEFDENFNYVIEGEAYYLAEIEGTLYYVPTTQTLNGTATFTFTVDGDLGNVEDLDVRFSAQHTFSSELEVYLESPQGQEVTLFAGVGFGENFQDTVLDDDASTNIGSGIAPFEGTYIPQGSLADFNGENPNGIWTLRVTDIFPEFSSGTLYRAGDAAPWGSATGTQLLLRNPTTLVSNGGNGGAINIEATHGDINIGNIRSLSESGNGGRVDLRANNNIMTGLINSSSSQGIGGDINLNAVSGNILTYSLDTSSVDRDGGNVEIEAVGDISTGEIITDSGEFIVDEFGFIQISGDGSGNAGNISIESTTSSIDTTTGSVFARSVSGDGGNIALDAGVNIKTASVDSSSNTTEGNSGNGGNITLDAGGNIEMTSVDSSSDATAGNSGNGGNITLDAGGNIEMVSVDSSAGAIEGNLGDGGNIAPNAGSKINTVSVASYSVAQEGNSGDGGNITLNAGSEINTASVSSYSVAKEGNSGNGGNITLNAEDSIITEAIDSGSSAIIGSSFVIGVSLPASEGNSGDGGNITMNSGNNIFSEEIISRSYANYGNSGNGGKITLNAGSNILNNRGIISQSYALAGNSGDGGNITMTAGNNITTTFSSFEIVGAGITQTIIEEGGMVGIIELPSPVAFLLEGTSSNSYANGSSGNGGNIALNAGGEINTASVTSYSISREGNSGNGGAISMEARGDIATELLDSSSISLQEGNSGNGGAISLSADTIKFTPLEYQDREQLSIITFSVGESDSGNGGELNITTNNLSNAEIFTLSSQSKSGQVTIESQPQGNLELSDLSIITSKQVTIKSPFSPDITIDVGNAQGRSGNVSIESPGNINLNNVNIESDTKGDENAGNVNIASEGTISLDESQILSTTNAQGSAGNITLTADQDIQLTNNSQLQADTQGIGNAGTIDIQANNLNLDRGTSLTTETSGIGSPGTIDIQANTIDIGQDAQISATVTAESTNTEGGGNININANILNISGTLGIFAETEGLADAGTLTLNPYKNNPDINITFTNSGFISARTASTGNGGNINIFAPENIKISGEGEIRVTTNNTGNAGTIDIQTENLTIADGVSISASTTGDGNAGAIEINTNTFTLETGTSLTTETESAGKAGNIEITSQQLSIGEDAQISATALEDATNTEAGGNITINSNDLNISGTLGIFAETAGDSPAGTLTLNPYRISGRIGKTDPDLNITFTENGFISARTTSTGNGGNINIFAPENINISGEGRITVETQGAGNAGIINIETQNLTIAENTTISAATSNSGDGGTINITPSQTFQLEGQIITETTGTGNGGKITINTGEMSAENSTISAKSTAAGNAGEIEILAQENIITGIVTSEANNQTQTADGGNISISSENGAIDATQPIQSFSENGNAGDVTLNAQTDITTNTISSHGQQQGGQINITTETGNIDTSNGILANYSGGGAGGNVTLEAPQGNITTSDIYSFADADGGQIFLKAGNNINITQNSNIISASEPATNSNTDNPGQGGNIILEAGNNINTTTARIYSGANEGDTGQIDIIAESAIETGQIDLASGFIREEIPVNNNFTLIPRPEGEATQGVAGNITITSNNGTIDTTADRINSRSPDGSGDITIEARGNITTGNLNASALNQDKPTTGGNVEIISRLGEINATQPIETFSERGEAGSVALNAEGHIHTGSIRSEGVQKGGDIEIESRSENSIEIIGNLNSYSTEGTAGNVTLRTPGNITLSGIRSDGMEEGGEIRVTSETGNIDATDGEIDSFSAGGKGGNVELNAPLSVSLGNVSSFGATESGDLIIQSRTATVNAGNVTTEAPAGSSGSIIINAEEVGTGNLSSIGTTSAGEINVEATDGSINTYDIEISSDGTVGALRLRASEDITTEDINQNAGEGDAEIEINSGADQTTGNINQTAEGDTINNQTADENLTTGDINQTAGNDAINNQVAQGDINTGNINQNAGNDAINNQTAGENLTTGNINQNAGNDAINNQTAGENLTTGNINQRAGNDAINNQTAGENLTTGNINQNAGNDAVNNQTAGENLTTGNINQNAGNDAVNNQTAGENLTTGNINQNAGNDAVNNQTAGENLTTGNINQTAGNDAVNNQIADSNQNIGNLTQTAENNTTNIQIADSNQNLGQINQTFGNESINIQTPTANSPIIPNNNTPINNPPINNLTPDTQPTNLSIPTSETSNNNLQPTPINNNLITTITPSNNNQTTNTPTAKDQKEESLNTTTDTKQILKTIDTINTTPLTVATGAEQVLTILEQNRINEYSDYFGEDFNEKLVSIENVRDILTNMASQTGKESAVVYINAYPDQLQIILYTKDGQPIIKTISTANSTKLKLTTIKLIAEIANPEKRQTTSYLAASQQLYQWLIAPITAELEAANIETILFSLDAGFRLLPLAVLHDGEQFLIEKYSISNIPSVSLMDSRYRSIHNTKLLGMGASEFTEQLPLPAVPVELQTISQNLWQGNIFLESEFTLKNLIDQRQNYPYPIIHLATHAEFRKGDISQSYIQLWDEKLRLNQVRQLGWDNPAVELLVLSACKTAVGSIEAELGFAGFAVATGVKSVLASLWYVNDEATLGLMTEFYAHLGNVSIKAEALRQTQLEMLRGNVAIENGVLRGSGSRGEVSLPQELGNIQNADFSHPYYWAGFTMVGSPW